MSILITGGAGFISSFLIRSLLQRGEKIAIVDVNLENPPMKRLLTPEEQRQLVQIRCDIGEPVGFFRVVREQRPDRIIHLAMLTGDRSDADPWEGVRVNVTGTMVVFEAARLFDIERVVWASSAQIFGRHTAYGQEFGDLITEDGPARPAMVYSACKALCEYVAGHYHRAFGLDTRGLRPIGVFGPGRQWGGRGAQVTRMIRAAALGLPHTMPTGELALAQLYVEDVARAFELALHHEGPELTGRTVNIGGHQTTYRQLAEIVKKVVPGADITVEPGDGGEPVTLPIDNSTLVRATGFGLDIGLEEGIRRTMEYFRQTEGVTRGG